MQRLRRSVRTVGDGVETFMGDMRQGGRSLLRSPMFSLVVVLTLALGIGANTAIFTLMNTVLMRPLPVADPEELYLFGADHRKGMMISDVPFERYSSLFSYPLYEDFRDNTEVFDGLAAMGSFSIDVYSHSGGSEPGANLERVHARLVSGNFFDLLGVRPARGRVLIPTDNQTPGGHPVAVISHGLWSSRFGQADDIVGQTIDLSGTQYEIVGVAQPDFRGVTIGHSIDVWVPMMMQVEIMREESHLADRETMWLRIFGRLGPEVSIEDGALRTSDLFRRLVAGTAGGELSEESQRIIESLGTELVPFARGFSPLRVRYARPLVFLMSIAGLVLVIACANVGNLQLARASNREREVAVRLALGSTRGRLLRHLLTESLILALFGGALGLLASRWIVALLLGLISSRALPIDVGIDGRVLGFTLLVSISSVLVFGLLPALRATHTELNGALKREGGVTDPAGGRWGLRESLLVAQVAICLPLLVAAGLLVSSLQNLRGENTGMSADQVVLAFIDPQGAGYEEERLPDLYANLVTRVAALPDIDSASLALFGTFGGRRWVQEATIEGFDPQTDEANNIECDLVTPGYFATIGAQLLAGRTFVSGDSAGAPRVAIVNETFARRFFGDQSPVGMRFGVDGEGSGHDLEVVGVVKDFKNRDLRDKSAAMAFFPLAQQMEPAFTILARSRRDPAASIPQLRSALAEVAPDLPVLAIRPLSEEIELTLQQDKMISKLAGAFGVLALVLASLGLYGIVAYGVARRTREIGVRMALGALRRQVVWMALKSALVLVALGIAIGLVTALALGRLMSGLLFGLDPADLETFLTAAAMLLGVALIAGYWPARRASYLDPIEALRQE